MIEDISVLGAIMVSRVKLAKQTSSEAATEAAEEWIKNRVWIASKAQSHGSFIWMCNELGLEPDAVRREIDREQT